MSDTNHGLEKIVEQEERMERKCGGTHVMSAAKLEPNENHQGYKLRCCDSRDCPYKIELNTTHAARNYCTYDKRGLARSTKEAYN